MNISEVLQILNAIGLGVIIAAVIQGLPLEWWKQRKEKQRIRRSLKAELESMSEPIDAYVSQVERKGPFILKHDVLSTSLFEANKDKIGLLSIEENQKISQVYSTVYMIRNLYDTLEREQENEEAPEAGTKADLTRHTIKDSFKSLKDEKDECLALLNRRLD